MPTPDNTYSTLQTIRTKVRRLTRSPSSNQLSDSDIDNYVNNFVLYDMASHIKQFSLRENFSFYCEPYESAYFTNTTTPTAPLYNFDNRFSSVYEPMYVSGYPAYFTQSQREFYNLYPKNKQIQSIGSLGDGVTTNYTGTISGFGGVAAPYSQVISNGSVLFTSVDAAGNPLTLIDAGITATTGNLYIPDDFTVSYGTINYVTGAYNLTFINPPGNNEPINSQLVIAPLGRPQAILYFDNGFFLYPTPDQPYQIQMEVDARPSELLLGNDEPELGQWWQYIAYGAAKKVFEDRMDIESVQMIMPEFKQQERLILRRTITQQTGQRVATIYTEASDASKCGTNLL